MQRRLPSFLGVFLSRFTLPQLPAALEAAAVIAAVMGFGLGWAWLAGPDQRANTAYPAIAMSTPESSDSSPQSPATPAVPSAGERLDEVEEWLVDGFNVLHTVLLGGEERSRWWTAAGRNRVLDAVAGATHESDHPRVWVVFDGSRPAPPAAESHSEGEAGRLQPVFAPSADDWLVKRVRAAEHPDRIVVVTADRKLANRARHLGATVQSPSEFLAPTA